MTSRLDLAPPSRSFAADDDAPHRLLPAAPAGGSTVFDRMGERLGHLEDVVVDEVTGKVAYAILRCGGFLGFGRRCRPLPWSLLAYDARRDGYVLRIERRELEQGPSFDPAAFDPSDDGAYRERVHAYYAPFGAKPHWT